MENPRQFSSIDNSDSGLYGSLTNRPPSTVAGGEPIDFEAINRQVINNRTQQDYVYKESTAEYVLRREKEIAASLRYKQEYAEQQARSTLQREHEQLQRNELRNRISSTPASPEVAQATVESSLNQPPRSTPERQPPPSTGSPLPTANGTAVRASSLVEPTAHPAPAILKEAIAPVAAAGALASLPRALPQAAGRLLIPGVGAGLTLAGALIAGQSVQQALATTAVVTASAYAGGLIGTAVGGPIGFYIGSMIGGFVGGYLGNALFPAQLPTTAVKQEIYTPNYPPFVGGGIPGVLYLVSGSFTVYLNEQAIFARTVEAIVRGPISGFGYRASDPGNDLGLGFTVTAFDSNGNPGTFGITVGHPNGAVARDFGNISVYRLDGQPDDTSKQIYSPSPQPENRPYYLEPSPLNSDAIIPSGIPAAGTNKGKTREIAPSLPSNNVPNGGGIFPGHGGLAPSYLPNPTQTPSNGGAMLPQLAPPQRQPLPFAEPEDVPMPRLGLGSNSSNPYLNGAPGIINFENGSASVSAADGGVLLARLVSPTDYAGILPNSTPTTAQPVPINDGNSPVPKALTQPITKTPTELTAEGTKTAIDQQKKDFDEQIAKLTAIATAIAALTPIIQGVPDAIAKSPTVQAANKETTKGAVCEIAQPGGCLGDALDNSANKINQNNNQNTGNILDKINVGANAAQLALLELMNTKLGDLIPGGLSGKLQRLSSWLHLDRVLNVLIWWQTLHNAYMLSANLGQTLTSAISNVLAAIGIKDAEGSPLEIGEILGSQFDALAKSVIGESEWGGIKAEYKKWNRIYQAAANVMYSIQSIGASILSALEVVGSWVASIGNAMRKWGEVGENAYRWMNPTPNFQNKFFTALETTENVVSQIDSVASEVLSIQETVTQISTQKTELVKALGEEPSSKQSIPPPEAAKIKADAEATKVVSATGLAISDSDKEADE